MSAALPADRRPPRRRGLAAAIVALASLPARVGADFLHAAGNWTHRTNMFTDYHFVPGYNEAGQWDILTGGNWSESNHLDLRLLGDAAAFVCPCPHPPCAPDEGPRKPGFNTSIFACVDPANRAANASYVVCSVFHTERTNITCVSPGYAVSCDIPAFWPDAPYQQPWENAEVPSHSFYGDRVTAVSCVARGMGEQTIEHLGNLTDPRALSAALYEEECRVVCTDVCRTVCAKEHMSVHQLFAQLNAWVYDSTVLPNLREYVLNGTLCEPHRQSRVLARPELATTGSSDCI